MKNLTLAEQYYNQLLIFFDGISLLFWLIPLPFIYLRWKWLNRPMKLFGLYLILLFFLHIAEQIHIWVVLKNDPYWEFMKMLRINDTNFFNVFYRLTGFFFLGMFYNILLNEKTKIYLFKKLIWLLCICVLLICFFVDGYNQFGTFNAILHRAFLTILPLLCIKKLSESKLHNSIWKNSFFLISLGLLIPTILSLFMSFLGSGLQQDNFILYVKTVIFRKLVGLGGEVLFALAFINYKSTRYFEQRK